MDKVEWIERFAAHFGKLARTDPDLLLDLAHRVFITKGDLVPEYAAFVEHDEEHLHDERVQDA